MSSDKGQRELIIQRNSRGYIEEVVRLSGDELKVGEKTHVVEYSVLTAAQAEIASAWHEVKRLSTLGTTRFKVNEDLNCQLIAAQATVAERDAEIATLTSVQDTMFKRSFELQDAIQSANELIGALAKALSLAPVYVTPDGVWLNFRPDPDAKTGLAMFQVKGQEAEVIRTWSKRANEALAKHELYLKGEK